MKTEIAQHAFRLASGEGQALPRVGLVKVGSAHSRGSFELIELTGAGSPLPHIHRQHDECFYIIEGHFTFFVGEEQLEAPADSVVFVPRGMRHSFTHSEGARALVIVVPAQLEGFFRELGAGMMQGRPDAELRAELAGKYDSWPLE